MRKYELMLILNPSLDDDAQAAVLAKVGETLKKEGARLDRTEKWGKRKLAYQIDHMDDGIYYVLNLEASTAAVAELDRVLSIADEVTRFMIVRRDEKKVV